MNINYSKDKVIIDILIAWVGICTLYAIALELLDINDSMINQNKKMIILAIAFVIAGIMLSMLYSIYSKKTYVYLGEDILECRRRKIKVKYEDINGLRIIDGVYNRVGTPMRSIEITTAEGQVKEILPYCTDHEILLIINKILSRNTEVKVPYESSELIYIKKIFSPYKRKLVVLLFAFTLFITYMVFVLASIE